MNQQAAETSEQETSTSIWKTDQRIAIAGFGGVIGGIGLSLLSVSRTGLGIDPGFISIVYPLGYTLLAIALLAGNARYKNGYGSRGNGVALLLALSLVSYAASTVVIVVSMRVFGVPLGPFTSLIGIAFFATRIFGTVYGVVLWRQTNSSRIAAGLFAVLLPALFVLGPLVILGVPAFSFELLLYLAFISFGFDLWKSRSRTNGTATTVEQKRRNPLRSAAARVPHGVLVPCRGSVTTRRAGLVVEETIIVSGRDYPVAPALDVRVLVVPGIVDCLRAAIPPDTLATIHADQPPVGRRESLAVLGNIERVRPAGERLTVVRLVIAPVLPSVDEFVTDRLAELRPAELLVGVPGKPDRDRLCV